ncbi:MAG: diguanylate cyclase [Methylococcales bacterium]
MKVLVVDDSKVIRMLVEECISSLGHGVIHAKDGDECLAYIKQTPVDLVLMDVEMPGMNGFQTTTAIREIDSDDWFPIIFLTTKQDDESFTSGILAGGDAYLIKPINPLRLQLTITAMERIYNMRLKLKNAQKELLYLAMYDQLTGLANRRNFDETLETQFKLAKRNKNPLSIIICDIDFFKIYNDTYGHQTGDSCLATVAKVIGDTPERPTDKACRYGGEEFTLILPDTNLQGGLTLAEKIRQAVFDQHIQHEGSKIDKYVTLSLGLATYNGQFQTEDELLKAADNALYRAKDKGRNRVESN